MRTATLTHSPASATRAGITARVAAHRYREPRVREIPRRGIELATACRTAKPATTTA